MRAETTALRNDHFSNYGWLPDVIFHQHRSVIIEMNRRRIHFLGSNQLDIETRRKKQQALMVRTLERRVRERAQQLYDEHGQQEGRALDDWIKAEAEILQDNIAAPLYRRLKSQNSSEVGA
jgi:hypothetical protein